MARCSSYIVVALACYVSLLEAQTPCLVSPPGLVSWWSGDDNTNDLLGGNSPTAVNAVTLVPGEAKSGFTFGADGYIQNPPASNLANQQFTWSAWVRPDGPGPNNDQFGSVIFQQDFTSSDGIGMWWRATDGRFLFAFGGIYTEIIVSTDGFATGAFYLVTATYDGQTFQLYVNGVPEGSFSKVKTIPYTTHPWMIGSTEPYYILSGVPRTWNGVIDEVEAYNRALTLQEIQAIFNAGSAGNCKGLVLAPRSVVFPAEPVGVTSPVKYVKVVNVAVTTVHFTSVRTSGDFSILGSNCAGAAVASGATCYIGVLFTPTGTGTRSGVLAVQSNGPGSPQYIKLTGTGQ